MSQHDMEITKTDANTGVTFRSQVNAALQALATRSSGATEPTVKYPYMPWADITSGYMKIRNDANNAWIIQYRLSDMALSLPIIGGSINNTPIGATTPSTGAFTTLSSNVGATAPIQTNLYNNNTSYSAISFNSSFASIGMAGVWGGGNFARITAPVEVAVNVAGASIGTFTSTGLSVSGAFGFNNTVTNPGAFSPTHKVPITVNGTTYYMALTTA